MISNYADHSANERTFLAWVRTTIAVVGFGLAASRIGSDPKSQVSEILLLISGALVVLVAFYRMQYLRKRIDSVRQLDNGPLTADLLLLLLTLTLFLLLGMFALHVG